MSDVSHNRLFNSQNPYQGVEKKVLCVCSAGLLRSPTAAYVLAKEYGYNTRAAGVDLGHALIPVDAVLLHWADEIVCMDEDQKFAIHAIQDEFKAKHAHLCINLHDTPIYVLNVPDMYARMDPELQKIILQDYAEEKENGKEETISV